MAKIILKSALAGVAGFVATPILAFLLVLVAAHLLDPRCGTPAIQAAAKWAPRA